jgi:hypothetical protein
VSVATTAILYGGLLLFAFTFAFMWGRSLGKAAENKAIRNAFESAGIAKDAMDKILASPLDPPAGLFDDWVRDDNN